MNTGALFVAVPAPDDPVNELSEEDQAHITMVWFGESQSVPADLQIELLDTLDQIASSADPFTAAVAGTAVIGPDRAGVLLIESEELVQLRNAMICSDAVQQAQALADKQFPWWLPHLTVSYTGPVPDDHPESIQIDRLGFWSAQDKAYASLQTTSSDVVTAAASVPPIWDVDDLPLGIRVASGDPAVRWYVARRAQALGQIDLIPSNWSLV